MLSASFPVAVFQTAIAVAILGIVIDAAPVASADADVTCSRFPGHRG